MISRTSNTRCSSAKTPGLTPQSQARHQSPSGGKLIITHQSEEQVKLSVDQHWHPGPHIKATESCLRPVPVLEPSSICFCLQTPCLDPEECCEAAAFIYCIWAELYGSLQGSHFYVLIKNDMSAAVSVFLIKIIPLPKTLLSHKTVMKLVGICFLPSLRHWLRSGRWSGRRDRKQFCPPLKKSSVKLRDINMCSKHVITTWTPGCSGSSSFSPSRLQHVSTASNPTLTALNTDKGAPPPMAGERTVINEATPVESGSVIPHLQPGLCFSSKCQQVTNDCQDVLCSTFPENIALLITNAAFASCW